MNVTLSLHEYDDLRNRLTESERQRHELQHRLADVKDSEAVRQRADVWGAAVAIIQFAVANLPPETSPGWPYTALACVARHLASTGSTDLAIVLQEFSDAAEGYETARHRSPKKAMRAGPGDFGPMTPEAALAHAVKTGDKGPLHRLLSGIAPEEPTSPGMPVEDDEDDLEEIVVPPEEEAPPPPPDE